MPAVVTKERLPLLLRLIANAVLQAAVAVAAIFILRAAFEGVADAASGFRIALLAFGLAGAAIARSALRVAERVDSERLGQDYVRDVRSALFDRLSATTPAWLTKRSQGVLMVRFVTDLNGVRLWVGSGLPRLVVGLMATVAALGALLVISRPLGGITLLVTLAVIAVGTVMAIQFRATTAELRRRRGQLASNAADRILSISAVSLSGQAPRERRRIDKQSDRVISAAIKRRFYGSIMAALPELATGVVIAVSIMALSRAGAGTSATVADLAATAAVIGLLATYSQDIARGATSWNTYSIARAKLNQVFESPLRRPHSPRDIDRSVPVEGQIQFRNISYGDVLNDLSFTVEPAGVTAVTGPNGSGKSLLIEIAAGLTVPESGCIEIDGVDVREIDPDLFAESIGIVSPAVPLVRGSWRRNLAFRQPGVREEDLEAAIESVGLAQHISGLERGLRTRIGGSNGIPHGIRQRIALVRALIGEPKILLLDDPDIHLDAEGQQFVTDVLASRRHTVLIATNNLARLSTADQVITLPATS